MIKLSILVLCFTRGYVSKFPVINFLSCQIRNTRVLLSNLWTSLYEDLSLFSVVIIHRKIDELRDERHHRRVIVEWLGDPKEELEFTAKILRGDAKNYHAWQHRQWVIREFNLWDNELDYVNKLLVDDLRNNSAWNQRYFVINNTTGFNDDVVDREVSYTQDFIKKSPNNESAWNYLKGVLLDRELSTYPGLMEFCQQLYNDRYRSPYLIACMIDAYEEMLENNNGDQEETLKKSVQMCTSLADEFDTIRSEYWNYVSRVLSNKYGQSTTPTTEQNVVS